MIIIGAGMAGLLAANMIRKSTIIEAQPKLPNNHSAVLRFRSSQVGDVLGIPFKKVTLIKTALPWQNPVADALSYSFKNTGTRRSDRSIIAGMTVAERFIAPPDFINQMAERAEIAFNKEWIPPSREGGELTISTIPMPVLMELLDYPNKPDVRFSYREGVNLRVVLPDTDAYVSLAVPDPVLPFSRISITGNELIVEMNDANMNETRHKLIASMALGLLGIPSKGIEDVTAHRQTYAKINPIDDVARKEFIYWATDAYNIFSLGRFATWRPNLLLDDLVNDVRLIERWARDRYQAKQRR